MKQKIYIAALLAGMLALAGCGGGGSANPSDPLIDYAQTQIEAIEKAATKEAVDKILEDLDTAQLDAVEDRALTEAANDRKKAIDDAANEDQKVTDRNNQNNDLTSASGALKTAISNAQGAGNDVTQALIEIVTTARDNLRTAITRATLVDDTSSYADEVTSATNTITDLGTRLSEVTGLNAANNTLSAAITTALMAGEAVTQDEVTAIETAHATLNTLIEAATLADTSTYRSAHAAAVGRLATVEANRAAGVAKQQLESNRLARETAQKGELTTADGALKKAVDDAVAADDEVTEDMVTAITNAQSDLRDAIAAAEDVDPEEKAKYQAILDRSADQLKTVQALRRLAKAAEEAREATDNAAAATARTNAASLKAALDASSIPGSKDAKFVDDNKTSDSVSALHGWTGAKYEVKKAGKTTEEGYLYTKLDEAEEGRIFGGGTARTANSDHEYQVAPIAGSLLTNTGEIAIGITIPVGTTTNNDGEPSNIASRISIEGFTATAGNQPFKKGTENDADTAADLVIIPGSYHGVPGDYRCVVGDGGSCRVSFNKDGGQTFLQGADVDEITALAFVPDNPNARITAKDADPLAEYGWWLNKSGDDWTVNVFASQAGGQSLALGTESDNPLPPSGTAKYVGGAAGKYAFSSRLGDSHDAGHFTAKVTLDAKFGDADSGDTISGTVNEFTGDADGMENWSVSLGTSRIGEHFVTSGITTDSDNGEIPGFDGGSTVNGTTTVSTRSEVTWSLHDDDDNASAGGQWQGQLWDLENGVPTVATGTFRATYGSDATMVGAFGADKE